MKNKKALKKTLKQGIFGYIGILLAVLIMNYFFEADNPLLFYITVGPFIWFVLMIPIYFSNKKQ